MSHQMQSDREELQKVGALIWERLYTVRVPYKETLSEHELRTRGVPTCGFDEYDRDYLNAPQTVVITIDAIAEYFRRGVAIHVVHYADLEDMYGIINRYLSIWGRILKDSVNLAAVPAEDLLLLDRLADKLYDQSRRFNGPKLAYRESMGSFFGRKLSTTVFSNALHGREEIAAARAEDGKHSSFADIITTSLLGHKGQETGDKPQPKGSRWS